MEFKEPVSDTDSVASPQAGSDVSVDEVPDSRAEPDVKVLEPRLIPAIRAAFAELDGLDLRVEFNTRACVMKTAPHFLRGLYHSAMRLAVEEATHRNAARQERGWRLFLLLPRLLLHLPPREATQRNENWRVHSRFSQRGVGFRCYRRADSVVRPVPRHKPEKEDKTPAGRASPTGPH